LKQYVINPVSSAFSLINIIEREKIYDPGRELTVIIPGLILLCFVFFISHSTSSSWVSKNAAFSKASASGLYLISYYLGGSLGGSILESEDFCRQKRYYKKSLTYRTVDSRIGFNINRR
jgi:hypothetical protein